MIIVTINFFATLIEKFVDLSQFDEELGFILHALKEEMSFGVGEERQIIWLLWHQRLHLLREQTQFEVITSSLNLPAAASNKNLANKLLVGWVCILLFTFLENFFTKFLESFDVLIFNSIFIQTGRRRDYCVRALLLPVLYLPVWGNALQASERLDLSDRHTRSVAPSIDCLSNVKLLLCPRPRRGGGGGGIKRSSASVVRPSVCLMSRTSALTRKPKGLGRRNFA